MELKEKYEVALLSFISTQEQHFSSGILSHSKVGSLQPPAFLWAQSLEPAGRKLSQLAGGSRQRSSP